MLAFRNIFLTVVVCYVSVRGVVWFLFRQNVSVIAFRVKTCLRAAIDHCCAEAVMASSSCRMRTSSSCESQSSFFFFSCVAAVLLPQADRQRKYHKFLNLPGGGRVPYDQDAPDLTLDLANIEGRYVRDTTLPA